MFLHTYLPAAGQVWLNYVDVLVTIVSLMEVPRSIAVWDGWEPACQWAKARLQHVKNMFSKSFSRVQVRPALGLKSLMPAGLRFRIGSKKASQHLLYGTDFLQQTCSSLTAWIVRPQEQLDSLRFQPLPNIVLAGKLESLPKHGLKTPGFPDLKTSAHCQGSDVLRRAIPCAAAAIRQASRGCDCSKWIG